MAPVIPLRAFARTVVAASAFVSVLIAAGRPAGAQPLRLDVGPGGVQADAPSVLPVISFDGRYTAFLSAASNLVPGDTDSSSDFFRYDRETGTLARADIPLPSGAGEYPSLAAISQDGRWLLFNDVRGDWVAGDDNHAFDVFLYDFTTGASHLVSVGTDGVRGNGGSFAVSMTPDARYIAFESASTTFGPGALDNGPATDVFVRDTVTGQTFQVSGAAGGPANGPSSGARVSPDGEWVAFSSRASNLTAEPDTNGVTDAYLAHWRTGAIRRIASTGVEPDGETIAASVSWNGAFVAVESMAGNLTPDPPSPGLDTFIWDRLGGSMRMLQASAGPLGWADISPATLSLYAHRAMRVRRGDDGNWRMTVEFHGGSRADVTDATGLEGQSGMSLDGTCVVYARGGGIYLDVVTSYAWPDPDGQLPAAGAGFTGLPEGWQVRERYYLAEGAENAFFTTRLALLNTLPIAHVRVQFLLDTGTTVTEIVDVPPHTRRTILSRAVEGLRGHAFSVVVESDRRVEVDRTVLWDQRAYGGHSETSVTSAARTWYFAEGSTAGRFDLFYLLENPNPTVVDATITWVLPAPLAPIVHTYTLPPSSRTTLYVDQADPRLASVDAGAIVEATAPILVERAMYYSRPGQPFAAGHAGSGVSAPGARWCFAEGATGPFFDTFLLLLNPNPAPLDIEVVYLMSGGGTYTKPYVLPPASRTTIWVDREDIPGAGPVLAHATFSTLIISRGGSFVAERAMWWPDGDWQEAHVSSPSGAHAWRWAFADGDGIHARTYVLVANATSEAGSLRVQLMFEDGRTEQRVYPLAAQSRTTVDIAADFPSSDGRRFGVYLEAGGGGRRVNVFVERATYWNAEGVFWAGGTAALATHLPPLSP